MLAQIVNEKSKIVKQVDLIEIDVQPDVLGAINNMQTQAQMAEVLHEIKAVSEQLQELRIEINNDRLAKVDSSFELLSHANNIRSKRLRDLTITNAMSSFLEAKHSLMRNFKNYIGFVKSNYKNSIFSKDCEQQAKDAFEALLFITRTVQLECMAYSMLGQYDICNECLERFNEFIIQNELNNRDTLLLINENLKENRTDIVDQFVWITTRNSNRAKYLFSYSFPLLSALPLGSKLIPLPPITPRTPPRSDRSSPAPHEMRGRVWLFSSHRSGRSPIRRGHELAVLGKRWYLKI